MTENSTLRLLCFCLAIFAASLGALRTEAELLSLEEQVEVLSVLGSDFIVAPIEAPVIEDITAWVNRRPGNYEYLVLSESPAGESVQVEQHIPLDGNAQESWQRVIEDRLVETYVAGEDQDVFIVEEVDQQYGFRLVMEPAVHIPRSIAPGQEWEIDSDIVAYRVEDGSRVRDGKLTALHSYQGAYRVRCPAGEFDAILVREDFQIQIGPLKAEDDRFLLFAKGVGLVAEVEAIKASAMFVFHVHEESAKVLKSYPESLPTVSNGAR